MEQGGESDWCDGSNLAAYHKGRLIGRGSTGSVYLLNKDDGSLAAVKELDVGQMSPKERLQAAQEVRLLSELSHPNIIAYYGTRFLKRRQVLEIYMEYAEGGTLADLISQRQRMPNAQGIDQQTVLRWTRQMISALRCVHQRKIIHRDLKPSNVFITQDGTVKLADFGVSAELSATEQKAETCCGTPFYLSPEMVSGKPYSAATDVWSLGCILWELLTLQRPFTGSNIMQLAMQIMSKRLDAAALEALAADADRQLVAMVVAMLSKEPAARPSVQQLHDDPFLSERLGQLYLRHATPSGEWVGALSPPPSRDGRSRPPSARTSGAGASAPPSAEAHAATRLQAVARGRRDRRVAAFLNSITARDEPPPPTTPTPTTPSAASEAAARPRSAVQACESTTASRAALRSALLSKLWTTLESFAPTHGRPARASALPTDPSPPPPRAQTPPGRSQMRRPPPEGAAMPRAIVVARPHSAQPRRAVPVCALDRPWRGGAAAAAGDGACARWDGRARDTTPTITVQADATSSAERGARLSLRAPLGGPRADEPPSPSGGLRLARPRTASGLSVNLRLRNELLLAADGSPRGLAAARGDAARTSVRLRPDLRAAELEPLGARVGGFSPHAARSPVSPAALKADRPFPRSPSKPAAPAGATAASGDWTPWPRRASRGAG